MGKERKETVTSIIVTSSFLLLVAMPGAPSSFLLLPVRHLLLVAFADLFAFSLLGLRPNVICYNAAAGACNRAAAWFSALEVLGDAAQLGLQLDSASVNLVAWIEVVRFWGSWSPQFMLIFL